MRFFKNYFIIISIPIILIISSILKVNSNEITDAIPNSSDKRETFVFHPIPGKIDKDTYLDSIGIPNIYLETEYSKNGKTSWSVIKNGAGRKYRTFSSNDEVYEIASGRYKEIAYALILHIWKRGNEEFQEAVLYDQNGKTQKITQMSFYPVNSVIRKNKNICCIFKDGIREYSIDGELIGHFPATEEIKSGLITSNVDGSICAIALAKSGKIMMYNKQKWFESDIRLSEHGDKNGILSCYPYSDNIAYGVVYNYINPYVKGLDVIRINSSSDTIEKGILFNSEIRNIGFNPAVYKENDYIVLTAQKSTDNSWVTFRFKDSEFSELTALKLPTPDPTENKLSFVIGGGLNYLFWKTNTKNGNLDADYDISNSISTMGQFETKYKNYDLAVNYLKDLAKDQTDNKVSKQLIGMLNISDYLPKSSILRLRYESSELDGVVKLKKNGALYSTENFKTKFKKFSALEMMERGYFWGFEYVKYEMPCVLGFGSPYSAYDPSTGVNTLNLVIGLDMLSYTKRYETDYKRSYISGHIGLGLGHLSVSDSVIEDVESESGKKVSDSNKILIDYGGQLELGYIWQYRIRRFNGLGVTINPGYRANGYFMGTMDSGSRDKDKLPIGFKKYDIYHGPFIDISVIY